MSSLYLQGAFFINNYPGFAYSYYFAGMEQPTKPKRPAALGFIFVTLLIDVMGFGIIIPVVPKLIEHLIHGDIRSASLYGLWLTIAYATMQFIFAPVIGNLSDKFGRRPVLLASLLGFSIDYLFLAFSPTIWWLFVGRIVAGITGASFTTATAYIADISTAENRAQNCIRWRLFICGVGWLLKTSRCRKPCFVERSGFGFGTKLR